MSESGGGVGGAMFEVWRQDDNGQRFLVSAHWEREAAVARIAELEAGVQHKQLYFVREREPEAEAAEGPR